MNEKHIKSNDKNLKFFIDFSFSCILKKNSNLPKPKFQLLVSLYIAKNGNINKNKLSVRVSCRTNIEVIVFAENLMILKFAHGFHYQFTYSLTLI